ncbi:MAG: diguanylate cyclase, partial [Gammaproteobacteria bacterium]|nr:diguanylate cyclase [Gammaproteobacteria bacterium]
YWMFVFGALAILFGLIIAAYTIARISSTVTALKKTHEELESRGEERTVELTKANEVLHSEIAERKQAEDKLKQAATVFENSTEGIIITDPQAAIISMNKAATEITGFSEAEALGRNPSLLKSDRHDQSFFQAMWASLMEAGEWRGEIWNRRKNGEAFPCWQSITAVKDESGNVMHYVSIISDITAIKEYQAQLEQLAHHDPLTKLPNRLLFNDRLEHALERAYREKHWIGVMFLDLDNFKPINDGLGHPVGDKVLKSVAERLTAKVREDDTVARIAGDEFAIILEEISDSQGVAQVAGKILSAFEAPFQIEGQELHVTITIGISLYPEDGKDVTTLIKNADSAMYRAKEKGKNRYCYYTQDLTETALERLQLENDLRVALKRNEFSVYYQPQYALATGQLTGAEALLRWQHPEKGLISPLKFIPIAEGTGLIIPLGEWVLREACAQIKAWQDAGHAMYRIGVNVAGQQIQRGNFVET